MKKAYIIAEIGVNHNGNFLLAKKLIREAKKCGADAAKFQIFVPEKVVSEKTMLASYQKRKGITNQMDLIKKLKLSESEFLKLQLYCRKVKIDFLASVFDLESLDFAANNLKLKQIKIASGEITNFQHLYKAANYGMNIILSTGASTLPEIELALSVILSGYNNEKVKNQYNYTKIFNSSRNRKILKDKVTLLHCVSSYPVPDNQLNLNGIITIKSRFKLKTGYSDHSKGIIPAVIAIGLGAEVIEKHLTLDNDLIGPDHKASLNPANFREMVLQIRIAEKMLGDGEKIPQICEIQNKKVIRRSLVAAKDVSAKTKVTWANIESLRLTGGIPSEDLIKIIGKEFKNNLKKGKQIYPSDLI
jgi:N-acetylneuraminate synthase